MIRKYHRFPGEEKKFEEKIKIITIIISIFGILLVTLELFTTIKISEQKAKLEEITIEIEKNNKELQISISKGQLATSLIPYILSGDIKEQEVAIAILEKTAGEMAETILKALKKYKPINETEDQKVLKEKVTKALEEINITKKDIIKTAVTFAKNLYDVKIYKAAANKLVEIEEIIPLKDENKNNIINARIYYEIGKYKEAIENYLIAIELSGFLN